MLPKPDMEGKGGRGWKVVFTEEQRTEWPASLDMFLVHVPGAHPWWQWYVVMGCSLADIPGHPPAHRRSDDVTHEISVWALDPAYTPDADWVTTYGRHMLHPVNFCEQFTCDSTEQANQLVFDFAYGFCSGVLSPDTDYRETNQAYLIGTVRNIRRVK